MSKDNEIIDADYEIEIVNPENLPSTEVTEDGQMTQVDAEFEYARANIIKIIEKSNDVLESTTELVKETEHPRMIEVYSGLIKSLVDCNKSIFEIREKKMKLKGEMADKTPNGPGKVSQTINNNTIFVGSTDELINSIKGKK